MHKRRWRWLPKQFLWRLTFLHFIIVTLAILLSGWALYHTACFLVDGLSGVDASRQRFNATLFEYLLLFGGIAVVASAFMQFHVTKKMMKPIHQLIDATKLLKKGQYPVPIPVKKQDEIGELIQHYNELLKQLEANEKQRKKLVEDVSHELRTPISNLQGYLHALQSGVMEGSPELFQALYGQTNRLTDLIEQMSHLHEWDQTALQVLHQETVEMRQLLEQMVQMFSVRAKEYDLTLQLEVEPAEVSIHLDGLQQVLTNLLDNAITYHEGAQPIRVVGAKLETAYQVQIISHGSLISEAEKAQLFDRFYRVDHSRNRHTGGSGLGLAIAKEIIENLSGEIMVDVQDGVYTFTIRVPDGG